MLSIEPHCIAAVPNTVLDVYIEEPSTQPTAVQTVSQLVQPSPPSPHSLTQLVSLSEETVQHLCKTMTSTLAKEFDFSPKTVSAPLQASNNDIVDPELQTKSPSNNIGSVQTGPSDDTPQEYGRQSASQENVGISALRPTNAARPQVPTSGGSTLSGFSRSGIIGGERNNTGSTSQNSIKVHPESDDNNNDSDWTDDSSSEHAGDDAKDNIKAPGIAPSKQERPGLIGSSTETMSERAAEVAARAKQGDIDAQYNLAEAYERGLHGLSHSDESAIVWYIKAGNQGHVEAQRTMGRYYYEGFSVPKDYVKAMEWYLKAANQGSADAQYRVGSMYSFGWGVHEDKNLAMEWYLKAAHGGNYFARTDYVSLKEQGYSIPSQQ